MKTKFFYPLIIFLTCFSIFAMDQENIHEGSPYLREFLNDIVNINLRFNILMNGILERLESNNDFKSKTEKKRRKILSKKIKKKSRKDNEIKADIEIINRAMDEIKDNFSNFHNGVLALLYVAADNLRLTRDRREFKQHLLSLREYSFEDKFPPLDGFREDLLRETRNKAFICIRSEEIREAVRDIKLFKDAPILLQALKKTGNYEYYREGEIICEQGEESDRMFVIISGNVEVLVNSEILNDDVLEIEKINVATIPEKNIVGELGFATGENRTATLKAGEGGVEILSLPYIKMKNFLKEDLDAFWLILEKTSKALKNTRIGKAFDEDPRAPEDILDEDLIDNSHIIEDIFHEFEHKTYRKNIWLNPKKEVIRVEEGIVELKKNGLSFGYAYKGDVIGLDSLFDEEPGNIKAYSFSDQVAIKSMPRDDFHNFIKDTKKVQKQGTFESINDLYQTIKTLVSQNAGLIQRANNLKPKDNSDKARAIEAIINSKLSISEEAAKNLLALGHIEKYDDGQAMCIQNEPSENLYFIFKGGANVYVGENQVAYMEAPSTIGEMGFATRGPRSATVSARGETYALKISYEDFEDYLAGYPHMFTNLLNLAAERLINTEIARPFEDENPEISAGSDWNTEWNNLRPNDDELSENSDYKKYDMGEKLNLDENVYIVKSGEIGIFKKSGEIGIFKDCYLGSLTCGQLIFVKPSQEKKISAIVHSERAQVIEVPINAFLERIEQDLDAKKKLLADIVELTNRCNMLASSFPQAEAINILENSALVKEWGLNVEEILEEGFIQTHFDGDKICEKNHSSESIYLILAGTIDVKIAGEIVAQRTTGDMLGAMGLARREPRSATLIAKKSTVLLHLPYGHIEEMARLNPKIAWSLIYAQIRNVNELKEIKKEKFNRLKPDTIGENVDTVLNEDEEDIINRAILDLGEESSIDLVSNFENDEKNSIWYIKKGHILASKGDIKFGQFGPGQFFGLHDLVKKKTRLRIFKRMRKKITNSKSITGEQIEGDTSLVRINIEILKEYTKENPDLLWIIFQQSSDLVRYLNRCVGN